MDGAEQNGAHRHLTEQLRAAILAGHVATGEALPSTRVLAAAIGVARGTVVTAYEDLAGEGYVEMVPGSGTFVAAFVTGADTKRAAAAPSVRSNAASEDATAMDILDLRPGRPWTRTISHRDWIAAWRSSVREDMPPVTPPPAGIGVLRERIADHLVRSRGFQCDAGDVIVTAGTSDAVALIVLGLTSRTNAQVRIACENPGYAGARQVIARLGGHVVPIAVTDGGMDIDALSRAGSGIAAALVTPSHQYPLGGRLDIGRRLELLDWASRSGSVVIEDDYDSEFRHGTRALPAIASLDRAGVVVHVGSFSKVLTPWLRCGYLVVKNPAMRSALLAAREDLGTRVSGIVQQALANYLHDGGLRRHLARTRREYAHKQHLVMWGLEQLGPDIRLEAIEGGLHAVLSWTKENHRSQLAATLLSHGIQVTDLADFYYPGSERTRDGIVFGYGASTDLELSSALETMRHALGCARRQRGDRATFEENTASPSVVCVE